MNEKQTDLSRRSQPEHGTESEPRAGSVRDLRPGTDYFYCSECGHHVACEPLEGDVWEVQCSRCVGECGLCSCRASGQCLDKNGSPVQFHIHVARGALSKRSQADKEGKNV